MRRAEPLALASVLVLLLAIDSATAQTQLEDVVATRATEAQPAASADYVAWSVKTSEGWVVYARPNGERKFRVNTEGTKGASGGIDGATLVYQEYKGSSDIKFFDLTTKERSDAPADVNTGDWEYWPSLSGDWLLFGRLFESGDRAVILYNLSTGESKMLDSTRGWRRFLHPGQVNGNYVVWERDTFRRGAFTSCEVYEYDISADATTHIANPGDKCQYAPSVNPAGTVYFGRSGFDCGLNAFLMSYPIGGPATGLVDFEDGVDFGDTYALDNGDDTTSVYLDPGRCHEKGIRATQDIQRAVV